MLPKNFPLIIITAISLLTACSTDPNTVNSSWMKDNRATLASKRLSQITIPGTHLANAYGITAKDQICSGELAESSITNSALIAAKVGTDPELQADFINYLNTQSTDIYGQLDSGERYLELSICQQESAYYTANYYLTAQLKDIIKQIKEFLRWHPDEIVFIDVDNNLRDSRGYMNNGEVAKLHHFLDDEFGSYLTPVGSWQNLTLEDIWRSKHRVIILSTNPMLLQYDDIWNKNDVFDYEMEPRYATIKKLLLIQSAIPHLIQSESENKLASLSIYSEFNPQFNDLSQLENISDDYLVIDYLKNLPESTPLNFIISDRQFNKPTVSFAIKQNTK